MIGKIKTIFSMQAQGFFRDRKQALTALVFGPLMVLVMFYAITGVEASKSELRVFGAGQFRPALMGSTQGDESVVFAQGEAADAAWIAGGQNRVALAVEADSVQILYDSSLLTDSALLHKAQELAGRIAALQIDQAQYPAYDQALQSIELTDISSGADQVALVVIPLASLIFIIALMLTNSSISSLATDAIAGERERGTFDMLRLSGTSIPAILLGKYAFAVAISILLVVLQAGALILGLGIFYPELLRVAAAQAAQNPLWFVPVLVCLVGIGVLTAALYMALSASFEKESQVGAYSSIVQLVLSLFTYSPNVINAQALGYLPISNVWLVLQRALAGESCFAYVASSTLIALAIASAALWYAATILEKDTKR